MSQDIFKQILNDHKELSSLPQTLAEVLRVVKDERSSAQDLAKVLMRDPALTAKVLRIVNSPFYGGRGVTTVTQAVVTLGIRAITALTLSTSIYDMTGAWQFTVERARFWRHSLQVALASRAIAEAVRYPHPEEPFVCGLLHDIGILVLEKSFPEKFERIWRQVESGERLCDLEEGIWGTDHARVGQFLLEQWQLPSVICQAVGYHHSEIVAQEKDSDLIASQIVALANMMSNFTIARGRPELTMDLTRKEALINLLEINPEKARDIEQELIPRTLQEAQFLEIDIGSQEEILMEANAIIYDHYLSVENLLRENQRMQREAARAQLEKAALESLKTISATFNHYINNAAATILGRAQLIEVKIEKDRGLDPDGDIARAMDIIIDRVNTISTVMCELKELSQIKTTVYHDDTYIIDIDQKVKKRLAELAKAEESAVVPLT
ncbi:MAG TPA: HDOD domain-containing protein [candidate division Zixibacteria bacterium]|nr:HDOD domain-containing protein [candidate division Zixibacteria bacterium]